MEAAVLRLSGSPTSIFSALPPSTASLCSNLTVLLCPTSLKKTKLPPAPAVCRSKNIEEQDLSGLPKEYYGVLICSSNKNKNKRKKDRKKLQKLVLVSRALVFARTSKRMHISPCSMLML